MSRLEGSSAPARFRLQDDSDDAVEELPHDHINSSSPESPETSPHTMRQRSIAIICDTLSDTRQCGSHILLSVERLSILPTIARQGGKRLKRNTILRATGRLRSCLRLYELMLALLAYNASTHSKRERYIGKEKRKMNV